MAGLFRRQLLALIVPPVCAVCREPEPRGDPVCLECRSRLVPLRDPRCRRCGAPVTQRSNVCRECRGRGLAFGHAWSAFAYEGVAREVVSALKSRGLLALGSFMASELAARAPRDFLQGVVVPVPAHAGRLRRRGFNQARAIAEALGAQASLPARDLLGRSRAPAQVGLERRARLETARGSVFLQPGAQAPPCALLVDDVYTTGATLDACARALIDAGAGQVRAISFARAVRG
jgi:ComF family protein